MQPFFLDADHGRQGRRFCVLHRPEGDPTALVVHLHALAEEMNKSRRMVASTARAMAQAGAATLVIDLLGCGDSSGDFGDATWDDWLADGDQAVRWLGNRWQAPLWLWGHRAGCLLAAQTARRHRGAHLLLWQPPASGRLVLQQFLRLKVAAQLVGGAKGVMEGLRSRLSAGETIDIAGYKLSSALAAGLEAATMDAGDGANQRQVHWLETSPREPPELLPAGAAGIERLRQQRWIVDAHACNGLAFWQTSEIEDATALAGATVERFSYPLP